LRDDEMAEKRKIVKKKPPEKKPQPQPVQEQPKIAYSRYRVQTRSGSSD
jgi:hypothetical protein